MVNCAWAVLVSVFRGLGSRAAILANRTAHSDQTTTCVSAEIARALPLYVLSLGPFSLSPDPSAQAPSPIVQNGQFRYHFLLPVKKNIGVRFRLQIRKLPSIKELRRFKCHENFKQNRCNVPHHASFSQFHGRTGGRCGRANSKHEW